MLPPFPAAGASPDHPRPRRPTCRALPHRARPSRPDRPCLPRLAVRARSPTTRPSAICDRLAGAIRAHTVRALSKPLCRARPLLVKHRKVENNLKIILLIFEITF
jgi:hypothetical protein